MIDQPTSEILSDGNICCQTPGYHTQLQCSLVFCIFLSVICHLDDVTLSCNLRSSACCDSVIFVCVDVFMCLCWDKGSTLCLEQSYCCLFQPLYACTCPNIQVTYSDVFIEPLGAHLYTCTWTNLRVTYSGQFHGWSESTFIVTNESRAI